MPEVVIYALLMILIVELLKEEPYWVETLKVLKKYIGLKYSLHLKDLGHNFEYQLWTSMPHGCLNM